MKTKLLLDKAFKKRSPHVRRCWWVQPKVELGIFIPEAKLRSNAFNKSMMHACRHCLIKPERQDHRFSPIECAYLLSKPSLLATSIMTGAFSLAKSLCWSSLMPARITGENTRSRLRTSPPRLRPMPHHLWSPSLGEGGIVDEGLWPDRKNLESAQHPWDGHRCNHLILGWPDQASYRGTAGEGDYKCI